MQTHRNLYLYLGRRGALTWWALEIAELIVGNGSIAISRQNESFDGVHATGVDLIAVNTFESALGAIFCSYRIVGLRRRLAHAIAKRGITRVVNLMPHVWTPFLANAVRAAGAQYIVVVHDAEPHPGDSTGRAHWWLMRDADRADRVVTLSGHVTGQLVTRFPHLQGRLKTLFMPSAGPRVERSESAADRPLQFLFFGRILPYKGIELFVEACESLRRQQLPFELSVCGEGDIGALRSRLQAIHATVLNRWVADTEVPLIMAAHEVVVIPNLEASQSGVISTAFAAGLPVIVTPVGGLTEQVEHGRTGLIAETISADALAGQMRRLIVDRGLCSALAAEVAKQRTQTSMRSFLAALDSVS